MQILGSFRSSNLAHHEPASVSPNLKLNSDLHMSSGFLFFFFCFVFLFWLFFFPLFLLSHISLLIQHIFITFGWERNMQNPKCSRPRMSSRHNCPYGTQNHCKTNHRSRQHGQGSIPGDCRPTPFVETQLEGGGLRQTSPPPANPASPISVSLVSLPKTDCPASDWLRVL